VRLHRFLLLLAILVHLGVGVAWIRQDRVVRDGDEEGHVGAAELIAARWLEGDASGALGLTFAGDLGEYPPLYAGVVGAWWAAWGGGDPGRPPVRGLNLLWPVLAMLWVVRLSRPFGPWAAVGAAVAVLTLPEVSGLGWHFMPEGALVAAVTGAVWALQRAVERPSGRRIVLAGLLVGAALLVKQTAVLYLLPVLGWVALRRARVLWSLPVALVVVLPWLVPHLAAQVGYGAASVAGPSGISVGRHLGFYPLALLWAAGPFLSLAVVAGIAFFPWNRGDAVQRERTLLALLWIVGTIALLVIVPRKYPRLLAPALPAVGVLVAAALACPGLARGGAVAGLLGGVAWWGWGAFHPLPVPISALTLDARCAQRWFRPPIDDDLALNAVISAVRSAPGGPVVVLDPPAIPCGVQTTFDWDAHLGPALRRNGVDRVVVRDGDPAEATVVVSFDGPVAGWNCDDVGLSSLGQSVWICGARRTQDGG